MSQILVTQTNLQMREPEIRDKLKIETLRLEHEERIRIERSERKERIRLDTIEREDRLQREKLEQEKLRLETEKQKAKDNCAFK